MKRVEYSFTAENLHNMLNLGEKAFILSAHWDHARRILHFEVADENAEWDVPPSAEAPRVNW